MSENEFWRNQIEHEKRALKVAELRLAWSEQQVRIYKESVKYHKEKLAEAEKYSQEAV